MNDDRANEYRVTITGDVGGQVAVGRDIQQSAVDVTAAPPTKDELAELRRLLVQLKARVAEEAPEEAKDEAVERVGELEEAITADTPDLTTMEHVKRWFATHLPKLAGLVTGVIVNPIVGKVVAAGGDALAAEFTERFGRLESK